MAQNSNPTTTIDLKSGFCKSNSIFYNKRKPIALSSNHSQNITTFISSHPHHGKTTFIDASTCRQLSFFDVWSAVDSVATTLSNMGIQKGHVIILLSPNSIFFPVICLSVMSLGAIITTTNPLNTNREIAKQISDSKPVLAFTIPQLDRSNLPVVLIAHDHPNFTSNSKIVTTLEAMMKKEPSQSRVKDKVTQDETATLLYSSDTTGASKGMVSSHRNLMARKSEKRGEKIRRKGREEDWRRWN